MKSQTDKQDSSRLIPSKSALNPKLRNDPQPLSGQSPEGTLARMRRSPTGARERVPISRIGLWQITAEAIAKSNWWQMFLIAVGSANSVIYSHVPLVGFAAVAGNTLTRNKALISAMSIWFANQLYGFTIRQYPRTLESLIWGLVMGLGVLLVTWLVTLQPKFSRQSFQGYSIWLAISLIGGYTIYQGSIVLIAQLVGGHGFSSIILWRIFLRDVIWDMALFGVHGCIVLTGCAIAKSS